MCARYDFPHRIEAVDDLPNPVRDKLTGCLGQEETLIFTFAFPAERDWLQYILVTAPEYSYFFLTERQILVIRTAKSGPIVWSCAVKDLAYFEVGTVLLYSWWRFVPATHGAAEIKITYNSVFNREIRPAALILRTLTLRERIAPVRQTHGMVGEELLYSLPFKFNNVSRDYWLAGEAALDLVFVPAIWVPFLRYFKRVHSCATAMILTDKQLLLVIEQGVEGDAGKYGEAYVFCPLSNIRDLSVAKISQKRPDVVRVVMGADHQSTVVEVPFSAEQAEEVARFISSVLRVRDGFQASSEAVSVD